MGRPPHFFLGWPTGGLHSDLTCSILGPTSVGTKAFFVEQIGQFKEIIEHWRGKKKKQIKMAWSRMFCVGILIGEILDKIEAKNCIITLPGQFTRISVVQGSWVYMTTKYWSLWKETDSREWSWMVGFLFWRRGLGPWYTVAPIWPGGHFFEEPVAKTSSLHYRVKTA